MYIEVVWEQNISRDHIKKYVMAGTCNTHKIWFAHREGKTPLMRHKHRWEINTEMDLKELGCVAVDW